MLTVIVLLGHLGLLAFVQLRKQQRDSMAVILLALAASAAYLLPEDPFITDTLGRGLLMVLLLIGTLAAFGTIVLRDMRVNRQREWWFICTAWALGLLVVGLASDTFYAVQPDWVLEGFRQPDFSILVMLVGWLVTGGILTGIALYQFYTAALPELANRHLFWALDTGLLLFASLMISSQSAIATSLGMAALWVALAGMVYARRSYQIFDVRGALVNAANMMMFIGIAAVIIFTLLYLVTTSNLTSEPDDLFIMALVSLLVAAVIIPIRQGIQYAMRFWDRQLRSDSTDATRHYSQVVSEAVELDVLLRRIMHTLSYVMQVTDSCLMLNNSTMRVKDSVELMVLRSSQDNERDVGYLVIGSPLYVTFAADQRSVSQFDIEYAPRYQKTPEREREFFKRLGMRAYAPIIADNVFIGILACGPKRNDSAFFSRDLELLLVLAQQTGIALRNARLLDDLQHLNKSMQSLNRTLRTTNDQLERMDSVKSDFVTIASHELRTPLAQLRGYTDILEALNEQGILDPDQTRTLVGNLHKATERMEELISAMLDVSQLDVNAMDLRFNQVSLESVLRMAIEPLTDPIRMRKLTLTMRGTRGLPSLQADLQRLVQAFRNIIVNAIKFTPDGGRIEIEAELEADTSGEGKDYVVIKIMDSGVGIARQNLEMIFKKFFRAYDPSLHSTGNYKFMGAGPGLGLTIARGVIEGHGGKIWVESPGHSMEDYPGSTFFVRLPISTPETARRVLSFQGELAGKAAISQPSPMSRETSVMRSVQESQESKPGQPSDVSDQA